MKNSLLVFVVFLLVISCKDAGSSSEKVTLNDGIWRAELTLKDQKLLPFILEYKDSVFTVFNAEERIEMTDIQFDGDSITMQMPVFEGFLRGKIVSEELITGNFIKPSLNRVVPFAMRHGEANRFEVASKPLVDVSGNWETLFSAHSEEDKYIAKGVFDQKGDKVTGTFRTTTGDYRYLEGVVDDATLKLSTFDGAHAFLFEATIKDSIMYGFFYSGNHWKEPFTAEMNAGFELPSAESLTYLKEGYDSFDFSFPNAEGTMVSLKDEQFKNKVVIVQIMGTWCPNCLDETKYYSEYYNASKDKGVEFVSLAFEYAPSEEKAFLAINRLQEKIGVPYPILLAQYGSSSKKKANEKLPMLNHVLSYPTSIFIDKKGKVRKIHTGFNGPATGDKYHEFVTNFEEFVDALLNE